MSVYQFTVRKKHFPGLLTLKPLSKGAVSVLPKFGASFYKFSQKFCVKRAESNYKILFMSRRLEKRTESYFGYDLQRMIQGTSLYTLKSTLASNLAMKGAYSVERITFWPKAGSHLLLSFT